MQATRNNRLLTLSLGAIALGMGVLLFCEHFTQVPVIPLHNGHVLVRDGVVVIESGDRGVESR
jgi:hypothetical protein